MTTREVSGLHARPSAASDASLRHGIAGWENGVFREAEVHCGVPLLFSWMRTFAHEGDDLHSSTDTVFSLRKLKQ